MHDLLSYLADEAGLRPAAKCYLDYRYLLALLAGVLVVWLGHNWLPPFSASHEFSLALLLSLVIWQPLFEEIFFRGIVQGQLGKPAWGQTRWLHISTANVITSVLFVGMHMIYNPPLFSLTVFVPSLVFGYFRDYCNSVYPSIVLHSAYNGFVFGGLFIYGNMVMP